MEVTKKYVAGLVGLIKAEYPNEFKDTKREVLLSKIEMWHRSLAKYPKAVVDVAFQRVLESSVYPPKLADIISNINDLKQSNEQSDTELWDELTKALRYVGDITYFGMREFFRGYEIINPQIEVKKTFEGLSPLLQEYVGSPAILVDLAKQETLEYEKGRFLKALPTLKKREEIRQSTNPEILALLDGATKRIGGASMLLEQAEKQ